MPFSAHSTPIQRFPISTWHWRASIWTRGAVDDASREIDRELAIVPFGKDAVELEARIKRSAQPPARMYRGRRSASSAGPVRRERD